MKRLTIVETILRNREAFFQEINEGVEIREKITAMLLSCFVFLAIYGTVMGASHSLEQTFSSMFKLPLLFLATLAICAPSLHFFYILFGARQTMGQMLALILTTISVTSVLMLSLAPITFFFLITGSGYDFFKLLNVGFFALAGYLGVIFLRQGIYVVTEMDNRRGLGLRRTIFAVWVLLYGFVGSQMAWTLSPFMGRPDMPFILFQQEGGNFFIDVPSSFARVLGY